MWYTALAEHANVVMERFMVAPTVEGYLEMAALRVLMVECREARRRKAAEARATDREAKREMTLADSTHNELRMWQ